MWKNQTGIYLYPDKLIQKHRGFFPTKDILPLKNFPSEVLQFLRKMSTVLNPKKNLILDFSDFYFSSYGQFCNENSTKIADFEVKTESLKIDFSFVSAHSASFMWIWPLLKKKIIFLKKKSIRLKKIGEGLHSPPGLRSCAVFMNTKQRSYVSISLRSS